MEICVLNQLAFSYQKLQEIKLYFYTQFFYTFTQSAAAAAQK